MKRASEHRKANMEPKKAQQRYSKNDLKEFKKLLEAEKTRLMTELKMLTSEKPLVSSVGGSLDASYDDDSTDTAAAVTEIGTLLAEEGNIQKILQRVQRALSKIEDGSYGLCDSCKRSIDKARLKAVPFASLCVPCKSLEEKRLRQR